MAAQRAIDLQRDKADLIARMELQRLNIAEAWQGVTSPLESVDRSLHTAARHPWLLGGAGLLGAVLLFIPGRALIPKILKLATFVLPYILAYRKNGVVGVLTDWTRNGLRKRFGRLWS